jgi:hypothetical protein
MEHRAEKEEMERFEIQPVLSSALPDVADFLHRWRSNEGVDSPIQNMERRLRWLLVENPAATEGSPLGYCLRDRSGVIRGLNLSFPSAFLAGNQRILGLCSGSFFVEPPARSMGFYLFKKYLGSPGYSFFYATTCNTSSAPLWQRLGGSAVPTSETEYILPLRLDVMMPAFVATRTSSEIASGIARLGGRCANPVLRLLTRPSAQLTIEPCQDWEKLSELFRRHRSASYMTSDRSAEFLQWRYGPASPLYPCGVYLFRDPQGNEGWFSLANLIRKGVRGCSLLDAIWPREQMSFSGIFQEALRLASTEADAIFFRRQPGLEYREYSRWVLRHRLAAPRAFVLTPKGELPMPLDSLDYDDSDYIAWKSSWTSKKLAQNGARRETLPDRSGGARRTLCASKELAQNGARHETVPDRSGGARRALCAGVEEHSALEPPPLGAAASRPAESPGPSLPS